MPEAYVVFENSESVWTRLFKIHFRHVSVVVQLKSGLYLHMNPRMCRVDFRVVTSEEVHNMYMRVADRNVTILKYKIDKDVERNRVLNMFTCVEFVKRVLNIHALHVQTPYQLYRYILKQKKEEVCKSILKPTPVKE
jgi:hypothetical protein